MDAFEAFECAKRSAGRLWVLEVEFRDLVAADAGRIADVGLDGEWLARVEFSR
jgi:hypothetical protein